jgi:hypothetical protein
MNNVASGYSVSRHQGIDNVPMRQFGCSFLTPLTSDLVLASAVSDLMGKKCYKPTLLFQLLATPWNTIWLPINFY